MGYVLDIVRGRVLNEEEERRKLNEEI